MDFELTADQKKLQALAADFARREIEPIAEQIDRLGKLPDDFIKKCADTGLLGMMLPVQYGGTRAGNLDCILAIEQLAYTGTGAWWLVSMNNSVGRTIDHFGSTELKDKYLPLLCDGTAYASLQFTEEETGSDAESLITRAIPNGDDYIVNGMKRFSTFGAREGIALILARDEAGKCLSLVIHKNIPGYTAPKIWELMGGGGIETTDVYFKDMRVPGKNRLGNIGQGFDILLYWAATTKIEQCAAAVGIAQAALDEAIKYTRVRKSRGKPISDMQGIRWMLADMQAKVEAGRWLTYRTAWLAEKEVPNWQIETATTKLFVVPTAIEVVETAKRLHGAYGYVKDFKIERLSRAIAGYPQIETSLEINRSMVGGMLLRDKSRQT